MHRRRGNPSQPPDLTVSHQRVGERDRYADERNDHDDWDVEVDHCQSGATDIPRDVAADETENDQQDHRKTDADAEGRWLTERELCLHLEQSGELSTRLAAEYSAQIRPHTWAASDTFDALSLVSLMKASSRFPRRASSSDTLTPLAASALIRDAARSPVPVTVT